MNGPAAVCGFSRSSLLSLSPPVPVARGDRQDDYEEYERIDDAIVFEEFVYRTAAGAYKTECALYERLHGLQGDGIPYCYATGTVQLPSPDESRRRPFRSPFLLLEYVEGQALEVVDAKLVPRGLARQLLQTVHSMGGELELFTQTYIQASSYSRIPPRRGQAPHSPVLSS
jgi:hypothetical protein